MNPPWRVPLTRFPAALAVVISLGVVAPAADVTASSSVDRTSIRLSDSVRVELAVEGPAPLRVELPNGVLDDTAADVWRFRPENPATTVELPGGRQRWAIGFRADPYRPGNPVKIGFATASVAAGGDGAPTAVEFPPVEIRVTTGIDLADGSAIRPITGFEEVRNDEMTAEPSAIRWLAIGLLVATTAIVVTVLSRSRREPLPSPHGELTRHLELADRVQAAGRPAGEVATIVADSLRRFIARSFDLPAERMTTEEILASRPWPAEVGDDLRDILTTCDRLRFESGEPDPAPDLTRRAAELGRRLNPGP